jgi:hypothetical protein
MPLDLKPYPYEKLNSRQKEGYNFQKVSAVLAEFGFVTIRLTNDWNSADFIAQHADGKTFLKVQLKSRLTFSKKYGDQNLFICFPHAESWYLFPHDEVLDQVKEQGLLEGTESWDTRGGYSFPGLSKQLKKLLEPYRLEV